MNRRDLAYELALLTRWEAFKIIRASKHIRKYHKLTKEEETLDAMVEELENE